MRDQNAAQTDTCTSSRCLQSTMNRPTSETRLTTASVKVQRKHDLCEELRTEKHS